MGGERYNILSQCTKAKSSTIVVRGGSEQFVEEAHRSLHDALMVVKRTIQSTKVVPGGGAQTPGIVELTREVFALPVRVATPGAGLTGLADRMSVPRMTVPAGLLLYGARQVLQSGGFGASARRSPAVEKVIGPVKRWLQDFF